MLSCSCKPMPDLEDVAANDTDHSLTPEVIPLEDLSHAFPQAETSALFKQQPHDFCVDEELGFSFAGHGAHYCLRLQKTDLASSDVAWTIARSFDLDISEVGYAGLKDKGAISSQWFSFPAAGLDESSLCGIESDQLKILDVQRNDRKIKTGSHRGNHFKIRLVSCEGGKSSFERQLKRIREEGVPNYFGPQRFGFSMANIIQVQDLMSRTGSAKSALAGVKRSKRSMLFSAARSYLFNQVLSDRVANGSWIQYRQGDVLNLDTTSRFFCLESGASWDEELQQRLDGFDIHLSGPLPGLIDGKDKYVSSGEAADIEYAVLGDFPLLCSGLERFGLRAGRRALRFKPRDLCWHWSGENELQLEFSLSRGVYATSLLRELCVLA